MAVCQRTIFQIARNGRKKGQNTPARFIFTRMYVREQFLEITRNGTKKGPNTPDLFSHGSMSENNFWRSHEMARKRPKYAGPIYFHADVCQRTIFEIARNGTKKGPNTPARFIFTRMYVERNYCGRFY